MSKPVVTSISFDKAAYDPGDTITATVKYTSPNQHGGDGVVGYSLAVSLADELTNETNASESGQSASFYVESGAVARNRVDITSAAQLLAVPGLSVSSLNTGVPGGIGQVSSFATATVSAPAGAMLVLWIAAGGAPASVSAPGLTWTQLDAAGGLTVWTAIIGTSAFADAVSVDLGTETYAAYDLDMVTGYDPGAPVVTSNLKTAAGSSAGTASLTFDAAGSANNLFLFGCGVGAIVDTSPGETPPWTQLAAQNVQAWQGSGYVWPLGLETQVSPDVSGLTASVGAQGGWSAIGIELNAFVSGVGLPPGAWTLAYNDIAEDGTGTAVFEATA